MLNTLFFIALNVAFCALAFVAYQYIKQQLKS